MIVYIALCSGQGIVTRVIRSIPVGIVNEGRDVRELFVRGNELDYMLQQPLKNGESVRMRLRRDGNPMVFVTVKPIDSQRLLCVYDAQDIHRTDSLVEQILSVLDAPEALGQEAYGAGYYEIQKLNSQLINYQRAQAKTNIRLQALLEETRKARNTIEVLERDALTGLYTERAFYDRAAEVLRLHAEVKFDIAAVDIEQFKIVNDTLGTETGDQLLMDLAVCLLSFQRNEWYLFTRARADTYFILLPHEEAGIAALEEKIGSFMENYPLPMRIQAKIGVYPFAGNEHEIARMCDRALLAARSIKGDYNRRIAFYNKGMHEKLMLEQKIVNTMEDSLYREDFVVYLQPKVRVATGEVMGAEALVRWHHPEFGMIPPGEFIPLFEKNGFIYDLDLFVWEKTCCILKHWKERGLCPIPVSVNVSRNDLYHEDLPEKLLHMIRDYALSPSDLHLEITESAYVRDSRQQLAVINRLKREGFILEMDDFGSGYSSLNTLSELPINTLKLDLRFLGKSENKTRRQAVTRLVINLAKELGLQVIAEGVETKEQADMLKSMGCLYAQGYFYGRPVPEREFVKSYLYGRP